MVVMPERYFFRDVFQARFQDNTVCGCVGDIRACTVKDLCSRGYGSQKWFKDTVWLCEGRVSGTAACPVPGSLTMPRPPHLCPQHRNRHQTQMAESYSSHHWNNSRTSQQLGGHGYRGKHKRLGHWCSLHLVSDHVSVLLFGSFPKAQSGKIAYNELPKVNKIWQCKQTLYTVFVCVFWKIRGDVYNCWVKSTNWC